MDAVILPLVRKHRHATPVGHFGARKTARPLPTLPVEYGSGWYHDAAIKDHERPVPQKD